MIKKIKMGNTPTDVETAVRRLATENPRWLPVLDAAAAVAAEAEPYGGEFAGSSVVNKLGERGHPRWIPNLRILVRYGLLEKSGESTRGGSRAYYRMPGRAAVVDALEAWLDAPDAPKRMLRLVGAGTSTEPPADTARRAGELTFEPRSWR